tara:strand:- start:18 stop:155 length:138 start_codon:yes stop_codon:yes gene_type:complete
MLKAKYSMTIIDIEKNMLGTKVILLRKYGNVIKNDKEGIIIANTP